MITVRHILLAAKQRYTQGRVACWVDAVNSVGRDVGPNQLVVRQARRLCAAYAKFYDDSSEVLDGALAEVSRHGRAERTRIAPDDIPFEL